MCIFDRNFLQQLIITLFALCLGIPFGLYLDRLIKRSEFKKQKKKILRELLDSFENNLTILHKIRKELNESDTALPIYLLDIDIINRSIMDKYDLFDSYEVIKLVDEIRDKVIYFNITLKFMSQYHSESQTKPHYVFRFKDIRNLIIEEISSLEKILNEASSKISY